MANETELNIHQKIGEITLAMQGLGKDGKGYGYDYVTLDQIMSKLAPQLKQHGLSMIQTVEEDQMITQVSDGVTTIVSTIPFLILSNGKNMNAVQALGASLTYSRRYGLSVMFGICADEDTDGREKKVEQKPSNNQSSISKPAYTAPTATEKTAQTVKPAEVNVEAEKIGQQIRQQIKDNPKEAEQIKIKLKELCKDKKFSELPTKQAQTIQEELNDYLQQLKAEEPF